MKLRGCGGWRVVRLCVVGLTTALIPIDVFVVGRYWTFYVYVSAIFVALSILLRRHVAGFVLVWAACAVGFFVLSSPYVQVHDPTPAVVVVEEWGKGCFGCSMGRDMPSLSFNWDALFITPSGMWGETTDTFRLEVNPPESLPPAASGRELIRLKVWSLEERSPSSVPFRLSAGETPDPVLEVSFVEASGTGDPALNLDCEGKLRLANLPATSQQLVDRAVNVADLPFELVADAPALLFPCSSQWSYWERLGDLPTRSFSLTDLPEEEQFTLRAFDDVSPTLFGDGALDRLYALREASLDSSAMNQSSRRMWVDEGVYAIYGSGGSLRIGAAEMMHLDGPFVMWLELMWPGEHFVADAVYATIVRLKQDRDCECPLLAFLGPTDLSDPIDIVLTKSRGRIELGDRLVEFGDYDEIEFWARPAAFDRHTHESGGFAFVGDVLAVYKNGSVLKSPYLWHAVPEHVRTLLFVVLAALLSGSLGYWFVRPVVMKRSRTQGPQ